MQYTVPKFIDQEDKIVGPITVRQFLIMIVGAIFIAIAYALLRFTPFLVAAIFISVVTGVVAFLKINGRPFHFFFISFIERTKKPAVRVWNKELSDAELRHYLKVKKEEVVTAPARRARLSTSHLSQLSLVVDTGGSYAGEDVLEVLGQPPKQKQ
jgi:hypothetical protein